MRQMSQSLLSQSFWYLLLMGGMTCLPGSLRCENLFNNSGFELGETGYAVVKHQRMDTNPQLVYEGARADATTLVSGKQSLFVPNRFSEQVNLFTHEVKLKRGAEYTFSIWLKSNLDNVPVNVTSLCVEENNRWQNHGSVFEVGKQWKRYSYTFKVSQGSTRDYHTFVIAWCRSGAPTADLWMDNIQLEEGALTDYKPAAAVEGASVVDKVYYAVDQLNGTTELKTSVVNASDKETVSKVQVVVVEDTTQDKVFEKGYDVKLAAGEVKVLSEKLPLNRYGAFNVRTTVNGPDGVRAGQWSDYAVVGKVEKKLVDLDATFVAGINGSGLGLSRGGLCVGSDGGAYIESRGMGREEFMEMLLQGGVRLIRDMDPMSVFIWKLTEPEEGKFDFTYSDRMVDMALRNGIRVLPVVQGAFLVKKGEEGGQGYQPKWVLDKSTKRSDLPDWLRSRNLYMAPESVWRAHLRALVEHFKGRITHYELFNEPNLYMKVDDYVKYVAQARDVVKKTDPAARMVGICSTGDLGGDMAGYVNACLGAGIMENLDIISFHPYDAPHLAAVTPADRQIEGLRESVKKFTKRDYPLWNSEIYYLRGPDKNYFESTQYNVYHAPWRLLTDLGEGVSQSMGPYSDTLFKRNLAPHVDWMTWNGLVPSANYVAINAFARHFEGSKPVAKYKWMRDVVCYVYEREGSCRAAFWNYSDSKDVKLTLKLSDEAAALYDQFGNKLSLKKQPLLLGKEPYYLVAGEKLGREAFLAVLKGAVVETEKPIQVGAVRLVPEGDGWLAVIALSNKSTKEVKGEAGVQGAGIAAKNAVPFTVEAGGELSVKVPVTFKDKKDVELEASVKIIVDRKIWSFPVKIPPPGKVHVSGQKAGEKEMLTRQINGGANPRFGASYTSWRDEQNLYLVIDVKDGTPSGASGGRNPWEQDCIELFFDTKPDWISSAHPESHHDGVARLFLMPYAADQPVKFQPRGLELFGPALVKHETQKQADGYEIKVTIPFSALGLSTPVSSKTIGFEILADNARGASKAEEQIGWSSDGNAHQNRITFGYIVLN